MRALLVTLTLATIVVVVVLLTGGTQDSSRPAGPSRTATVALRAVPAPRLTDQQINRQDPPDARRQRGEAQAFDRRPLLNALPTTLHGVTFDVGGLASDGRTTILRAHAKGLGLRRARIAYETLRRQTGDRSRSYRLQIHP